VLTFGDMGSSSIRKMALKIHVYEYTGWEFRRYFIVSIYVVLVIFLRVDN
jgi:hypothetical protein